MQVRRWIFLMIFTLCCPVSICGAQGIDPFKTDALTTDAPQIPWQKPPDLTVTHTAARAAARVLPHKPLTLPEITDFALRNNPETRLAWYQAKEAAANVGQAKSAYLPDLDGGGGVQFSANVFASPTSASTTYGPNFSLSYLLLDFGTRANDVLAAQYALIAANLNQNNVIQQVILTVEQAYYSVLGQQALVKANRKSVVEAKASLNAAKALRANGMATIGDVYQAQGSLAQANLNLQTAQGNAEIALGQLTTAMGLPANTKLRLAPLQKPFEIKNIHEKIEELLADAERYRPDLLAAEAQVRESRAEVAAAKAAGWPTLTLNATAEPGGVFSNTNGTTTITSLTLSVPLFTGFSYTYSVKSAQAQLKAAEAARDQLNQQVQLQVWQAYYTLQTAEENLKMTAVLLESGAQANRQAVGQYKNGVGDILSVLTTQTTLANARVQNIQALLNWYTALAQLSAAVGILNASTLTHA